MTVWDNYTHLPLYPRIFKRRVVCVSRLKNPLSILNFQFKKHEYLKCKILCINLICDANSRWSFEDVSLVFEEFKRTTLGNTHNCITILPIWVFPIKELVTLLAVLICVIVLSFSGCFSETPECAHSSYSIFR